jgi:argininosuccinate lyase
LCAGLNFTWHRQLGMESDILVDNTGDFDPVSQFRQSPAESALLSADLRSSQAHVQMLGETQIVSPQVSQQVIAALKSIENEVRSGQSFLHESDSSIHQALKRRLSELVGEDLASILNIAKSSNDQIATDIKLWLRDAVDELLLSLLNLRQSLLSLAQRDFEIVMPGYTHMQPALPILLSHWWLANQERFRRDFDRLFDFRRRLNTLPLGAGELAGINQPIDRRRVAVLLEFEEIIENSLDAVSDRDYLVEFGACASLIGTHLSQMSSDLLLWATQEFGFIKLRQAFVTGSRSMPQKQNPALLEILRARPATINGHLVNFLTQLKALPMGFCDDLQECLPGLVDIVTCLHSLLTLATSILPAVEVNAKRMKEAAYADLTNASNALDYLLARGLSAEKASGVVEALVHYCKDRHKYLSDLALSEWQHFCPAFDQEIYAYVTLEESLSGRSSLGGTSQEQVSQALQRAAETYVQDKKRLPQAVFEKLKSK